MNQALTVQNSPCIVVDQEWRRWIAENLLLDDDPVQLTQILMQNGIAQTEAVSEVDIALKSPYLHGAKRLQSRLVKHDWVLDIYRKLNRLRPSKTQVPRRERLSREEFLSEYYSTNQPVIITGMMDDWPAMQKWNLAYFKTHFASRIVEVQFGRNSDDNYEMNSLSHKRKMRFGDYVDLVASADNTNDFYMTANNDSLNRQALGELWADIVQLPEYLSQDAGNRGFLWFGPAGTVTPFHHDLTNNFMAQVMGRKRLRLIPACEVANVYNLRHCFTPVDGRNIDLQRFPNIAKAELLECEIAPGEILFLPVGCWHFVEGLETSVTIAFTNFLWDNDFYSNYPELREF